MFDPANLTPSDSTANLGPLASFLWAAVSPIISLYYEIKPEKTTGLPTYYKNVWFWLVRLLVTANAGALAVAEGATKPPIAVSIGPSAPAILQILASTGTGSAKPPIPPVPVSSG